jgi:hypothetical protein
VRPVEPVSGHLPPAVTIVTDLTDGGGDLGDTANSIVHQSLHDWRWSLAAMKRQRVTVPNDPRTRVVRKVSRASALWEAASGESRFIATVDAGEVLGPTALEKWAWFLETHPDYDGVTTPDRERARHPHPQMIRGSLVAAGASLDTALHAARKIAVVPIPDNDGRDVSGDIHSWSGTVHEANAPLPEGQPFANPLPKRGRRLLVIGESMDAATTDRSLLDLLDRLARVEWETTVATTVSRRHTRMHVYAERTPDLFPLEQFLPLVDYPRFLVYLIESRRVDVVMISDSELGYRLLPYLRARCPGTTFVDLCRREAQHGLGGSCRSFSLDYEEFIDLTIADDASVDLNHLLEVAIASHTSSTSPVSPAVALTSAKEAIELTRLARVCDSIWAMRVDSNGTAHDVSRRAYYLLAQSGGPLYRYGLRRGWRFVPRIKVMLSRVLIGG